MLYLGPVPETVPTEGYRFLYPGAMSLFSFIGFSVLRIPNGYSSPLYLVPLIVSVILTYGMFWFIWIYFGAGSGTHAALAVVQLELPACPP